MDTHPLARCRRCGHRCNPESMHLLLAEGRGSRICTECYLELVEKHTGYRQGKLEFANEPLSPKDTLPF